MCVRALHGSIRTCALSAPKLDVVRVVGENDAHVGGRLGGVRQVKDEQEQVGEGAHDRRDQSAHLKIRVQDPSKSTSASKNLLTEMTGMAGMAAGNGS